MAMENNSSITNLRTQGIQQFLLSEQNLLYLGFSVDPEGGMLIDFLDQTLLLKMLEANTSNTSVHLKSLTYNSNSDELVVWYIGNQVIIDGLVDVNLVGNLVLGLSLRSGPLLLLGRGLEIMNKRQRQNKPFL